MKIGTAEWRAKREAAPTLLVVEWATNAILAGPFVEIGHATSAAHQAVAGRPSVNGEPPYAVVVQMVPQCLVQVNGTYGILPYSQFLRRQEPRG